MYIESDPRFKIMDFFYKGIRKIIDQILKLYWKLVIGSIGKDSFIKPGVKIVGNPKRITIGDNFKIWHRSFFAVGNGKIKLGSNGHLGVDVYINASQGNVIIGNYVAIAPKTQIYSYSDHYEPGRLIGEIHKIGDVIIENNVLIGSGTIILPGITIHEGAIIASGSVVTKDIPSFTIVGGIPAKELKKRE